MVLVGVKAWQVPEAAEAMRPMIGPETFVLPLQNGLEAPAQLSAILGHNKVPGKLSLLKGDSPNFYDGSYFLYFLTAYSCFGYKRFIKISL